LYIVYNTILVCLCIVYQQYTLFYMVGKVYLPIYGCPLRVERGTPSHIKIILTYN